MKCVTTTIDEEGGIAVPAEFLRDMGLQAGDAVVVEIGEGELRVRPLAADVRRAQDLARPLMPEGSSPVDELIAERRAEAARD
jgi:AbrB family looped-hinge helix DNA binding protein